MVDIQESVTQKYPKIQAVPKPILSPLFGLVKRILHQGDINGFLEENQQAGPFAFVESVLDYFSFAYKFSSNEIENIPSTGRVVIIANHPLGALDALSLIHLVQRVRSDIKVVANDVLGQIKQLKPILVGIDTFGEGISKASISQVYQTLNNDEALIIFPSGEVSRARPGGVKDTKWRKGFLKFATNTSAPILPIYIRAKNSALFYTLSSLNKRLSAFLLPHEMYRKKNSSLEFVIGESIPYKSYSNTPFGSKDQVKLFKKHLYRIAKGKKPVFATQRCIAHPENRQILRRELQECRRLGETSDGKEIYLYDYAQASVVLQEIGRLREYTFRMVEEGTGKKRDKDTYDHYYKHIILWDDDALEIAGAYRIAESDFVYDNYGKEGFYTDSLFDFDEAFAPYLKNSIELGRSFVQPKYWGSRALDYLWQGIGAYLYENPHIHYMFGPVTLSASMPKAAQEMILYYYDTYHGKHHEMLRPKNPFRFSVNKREDLADLFRGSDAKEDFGILKEQLSYFDVTVPTLYKQYTDLCDEGGIVFMGYNVDKDFGDCVDSFIMADVRKMKEKKRSRYIKSSKTV